MGHETGLPPVAGRGGYSTKERWSALFRVAFLAVAITDGAALLPMLFPSLGGLLLGFSEATAGYRLAMNSAAALMLGWTILLAWAYRRPVERRFVAALTVLVICGLACAEMIAVREGAIGAWRMAPTRLLQAALLLLFAAAYHRSMPGKAHANAGARSRQ